MQVIPKIIHQTWKSSELPADMLAFQQSWITHHPHWEYRLWTDQQNRQFLQTHYPWFLKIYDRYSENICRVDAIRYFILMHHGGVFIDLDFECLQPLDDFLDGKELVFGLEPSAHVELSQSQIRGLIHIVCPSLMASRAKHPFWSHVCQALVESKQLPGVLDATGPFLLTRAYDTFLAKDSITLASSEIFYPVTKFDCWDGKLDDPEFRQAVIQKALAVHHWHGTWFQFGNSQANPQALTKAALPLSLMVQGRIVLSAKFRHQLFQALELHQEQPPLISCMMVTKHRIAKAKLAIQCFQNQTYPHKELVIVDDDENNDLAQYVLNLGDTSIRHVHLAPQYQTLGELRNLALSHASGTYACQWDDDDLVDPLRLEIQLSALQALNAEACFLQRWLMWWPEQRRVATSRTRIWEGSILCRRDKLPAYPTQRQGEDTIVSQQILQTCRVALLDQPQLYLYIVHQENTFQAEHFEQHWQKASARFENNAYEVLMDGLAEQMPVLDYLKLLGRRAAPDPVSSAMLRGLQPDNQVIEQASTHNAETLISAASSPELNQFPPVLILTPVKNAASVLSRYVDNLFNLSYPHDRLSVGLLESDSEDGSFTWLQQHLGELQAEFRNVHLYKCDLQFSSSLPRWTPSIQFQRRSILAKSRNRLLQQSLQDEVWVLWLDVDVVEYPADIIQQLLQPGKDIIVPHCVVGPDRHSFDTNTFQFKSEAKNQDWSRFVLDGIIQPPRGEGRLYLEDLRSHPLTKVDSIGATMLLIKADLHRDGLLFPPFSYRQYIETEGLAMMAQDMGYTCWGMPQLEIVHVDA
ncbi:MAG: glycosyltransferase [Cyanobacteria bacterium P01_B01_bin.77]